MNIWAALGLDPSDLLFASITLLITFIFIGAMVYFNGNREKEND